MNSLINQELDFKQFIPSTVIPKLGKSQSLDIYENDTQLLLNYKNARKRIVIEKKIKLTEDDFIAIGLYFAEGYKRTNDYGGCRHSGEIQFSNSDLHCLLLLTNFLKKFGVENEHWKFRVFVHKKYRADYGLILNYWISKLGLNPDNMRPVPFSRTGNKRALKNNRPTTEMGCLDIAHSSVILRNVFLNFIDKILDECIQQKNKNALGLILQGFFAGDGNVDYSRKFNRRQLEFTVHDLELLNKLKNSLEILGLNSIKETWPEKTKTHSKAIRIYNKHDFEILAQYKIPNFLEYKRNNFMKMMSSY